jgi:hypothetical protein
MMISNVVVTLTMFISRKVDAFPRAVQGGGATLLSLAESLVHVPRGRVPAPLR